jgi:3-deoxy-D-manno-octulosonic-acid transferase
VRGTIVTERPPLLARLVYGAALWLALPAVWARLVWRGHTDPAYRLRRGERFGWLPADVPKGPVWFHTVSAGETIAAAPLIRALKAEFPEVPFLVTTMTPTGSAQVRRLLPADVAHCYAPYDFGFAVRRFLARVQPRLLVLMETELWPNLIGATADRNVPVVAINARLSERSARGYARIGWLTRPMLRRLQWIACQYPDHVERFRSLGAAAERVEAMGSVKFDLVLPRDHTARVAALRAEWRIGERPVWIAASTHPGEDEIVLAAHRALVARQPSAALVLVPRHPERSDAVARLAARAGFEVCRLSAGAAHSVRFDVLVGDTMGELLYLYGLARVAFVGGSLAAVGGHNPIEPAALGLPVLMGPHQFNFTDVVRRFAETGSLQTVRDETGLAAALERLLSDDQLCDRLGAAARQVLAVNGGASERLLARLRAEIRRAAVTKPVS